MVAYRQMDLLKDSGFQKNLSFAWWAIWPPDLLTCSGFQKNLSFVWVPLWNLRRAWCKAQLMKCFKVGYCVRDASSEPSVWVVICGTELCECVNRWREVHGFVSTSSGIPEICVRSKEHMYGHSLLFWAI